MYQSLRETLDLIDNKADIEHTHEVATDAEIDTLFEETPV